VPEEVPDRLAEERARKWMWELLALRHRDIARAVAANLSRRTGHAREDLEQIAMVGIILAARR
jgi:DNA-directed RNA polymerase specialized sigma subunit